jgi:hypothetical protein
MTALDLLLIQQYTNGMNVPIESQAGYAVRADDDGTNLEYAPQAIVTRYATAAVHSHVLATTTRRYIGYLKASGGGGGGANSGLAAAASGSGGGEGAWIRFYCDQIPTDRTLTITLGAAGVGGANTGLNGTAGANATLASAATTLTCGGGGAGGGSAAGTGMGSGSSTTMTQEGGAAGQVSGSLPVGSTELERGGLPGGFGFRKSAGTAYSGAGGGGAPVQASVSAGATATVPGGGGSGALSINDVDHLGGDGLIGVCVIVELP